MLVYAVTSASLADLGSFLVDLHFRGETTLRLKKSTP